ncbi:MAG TPA: S41 family peptidase [Chitinophagaceae bacterium]|jgi:hypothetical protein|nr:S41 family peptidase [Chitinophagaceae bacterium]
MPRRIRPLLLLLLLLTGLHRLAAQTCSCAQEFTFLTNYMEANHPGLNALATSAKATYTRSLKALQEEMRAAAPQEDCILYLQAYFTLIRDHHIRIDPVVPPIRRFNTADSAALDSFYRSTAFKQTVRRTVDSVALARQLQKVPADGLEGWYRDPNEQLIAVVPDRQGGWEYSGIVVTSKSRLFPVGTVRYQFRKRPEGVLWAKLVLPDHQRLYTEVSLTPMGLPYIGLTRLHAAPGKEEEQTGPYSFSVLNEQTNYLRLRSFQGHLTQRLSAFYDSIGNELNARPYLIIDIRDNGGGSDGSFWGLIPYLYTRPIQTDQADLWVSAGNIRRYEESLQYKKERADQYAPEVLEREQQLINRMKAIPPNRFIPLVEGPVATITSDSVRTFPKRIIVLMNKGCSSSAEAFIYYAKQSAKVVTMGTESGGMMGFGNVLDFKTPCFGYPFRHTTFKYRDLQRFEFIGMEPDIRLPAESDWIQAALRQLEKE